MMPVEGTVVQAIEQANCPSKKGMIVHPSGLVL